MIKSGVVHYDVTFAKVDSTGHVVHDSLFIKSNLSYTHYFTGNSFALENINPDSTIRIRHYQSKNGQGTYFFNLAKGNYKIDSLVQAVFDGKRSVDRLSTKQILGYNCHLERFFISDENFVDLYVTKSVKPGFNYYHQIFDSLKGFPLQIVIRHKDVIYKYMARQIIPLPAKYPLLPDLDKYKLIKEGPLKEQLLRLTRA